MPTNISTLQRRSIGLAALLLASILILILTLTPAPTQTPTADNVQPAILAMLAEEPDTLVRVIIQKSNPAADVASLVAQMGGTVIKDLPIINAVVAEIRAETAVIIARHASVNWVSLDGPIGSAGKPPKDDPPPNYPQNYFLDTLGVPNVWSMGYDGSGVGIAIIDSGVSSDSDFTEEMEYRISFNPDSTTTNDVYGHGTHVAGIAAGNGSDSNGFYQGIAPEATIYSMKISDENGMAYESDVVDALQWVLDNYTSVEGPDIRIVNMSINSSTETSYHNSPMAAATEILWFNGIVVVSSAGNRSEDWSWNTIDTAPANDPFIITVGASHENWDSYRSNDYMPEFSANGVTSDGFVKPDIAAPGKDIYSVLSKSSTWDIEFPDRCAFACEYFRLSGTSMAAPMVSGAVALLLDAEPNLTPDQVKYRLMNTGSVIYGDSGAFAYLDVYDLITTPTTESANTGIEASQLLWTGDDPINWDSVNWGSVNWGSVNWGSVNWGSVNWGSVNWGSVSWAD